MKKAEQHTLPSQWRIFVGKHEAFVRKEGGVIILRDDQGMLVGILPYKMIGL
jgi:hypothetical protein